MKKIILPALLVGGLTLFSFTTTTGGGVNKVGSDLQQKTTGLKFTQEFNNLSGNEYNLANTQLIESKTEKGVEKNMRGSWIFRSKLSLSFFDANFITWDDSTTTPRQAAKVVEILEKYSSSGSASRKVNGNLYEVSSQTKFSPEDEKAIRDLIEKEYNLSDSQIKASKSKVGVELKEISY